MDPVGGGSLPVIVGKETFVIAEGNDAWGGNPLVPKVPVEEDVEEDAVDEGDDIVDEGPSSNRGIAEETEAI